MWRNWNPHTLLMEMEDGVVTSAAVSQKTEQSYYKEFTTYSRKRLEEILYSRQLKETDSPHDSTT